MHLAVGFDVVLRGVLGVLHGVHVVAVGQMSVVTRCLVIAFLVMPCGFAVMTRSVLVVLRCLGVMMRRFVRHGEFLSVSVCARWHWRIIGHANRRRGYRKANSV